MDVKEAVRQVKQSVKGWELKDVNDEQLKARLTFISIVMELNRKEE